MSAKSTKSLKKHFLLWGQLNLFLTAGPRFWVVPGNGPPIRLHKLKHIRPYLGQLPCFSPKSNRTSNDAEWLMSPCPLLHEACGSLSLNQLPFLDKACLKRFSSLAWVCPCQNPAFLETSCLCSNTVCIGRPAPCMTNEDSKPTSSADFQSEAHVKENSASTTR